MNKHDTSSELLNERNVRLGTRLYRQFLAACGRPYSPSDPPTFRRITKGMGKKARQLFELNMWVPPWLRFMPSQSPSPEIYSFPRSSRESKQGKNVSKSSVLDKPKTLSPIASNESESIFSDHVDDKQDARRLAHVQTGCNRCDSSKFKGRERKGILRRSSTPNSFSWWTINQVRPLDAVIENDMNQTPFETAGRHVTWSDQAGTSAKDRTEISTKQKTSPKSDPPRPKYLDVSEATNESRLIDSATLDARYRSVRPEQLSLLARRVQPSENSPVFIYESPLVPESPTGPEHGEPETSTVDNVFGKLPTKSTIGTQTAEGAGGRTPVRRVHSPTGVPTFFPYGDLDPVRTVRGETVHVPSGGFGIGTVMRLREPPNSLVVVLERRPSTNDALIKNECRALMAVQGHPSFPKLYGMKTGHHLSTVIEFVGNRQTLTTLSLSLAVRLNRHDGIPPHDWVLIVLDVASGLDHLHSRGYVYCDLRTDGVLLWKDKWRWRAKIVDLTGTVTAEQAPGATVHFDCGPCARQRVYPHLAPEILDSETGLTPRADVYSLGYLMKETAHVSQHRTKLVILGDQCCSTTPKYRPSLQEVITKLMIWACQNVKSP